MASVSNGANLDFTYYDKILVIQRRIYEILIKVGIRIRKVDTFHNIHILSNFQMFCKQKSLYSILYTFKLF